MWTFGALSLAAPWALAFVALLPLLWWLLKVLPPAPRRLVFPAIRLLFGLSSESQTAARTPLWLILVRLLAATLVIAAVAHPLLNVRPLGFDGPLLLVVDNGWAAAKQWSPRHALMDQLIADAGREGRPVVLLATAPPADGGAVRASGLLPATEARAVAGALVPHPWPDDRNAALAALAALPQRGPMRVIWISDGLDSAGADAFARKLATFGSPEVVMPQSTALPRLLMPPAQGAADLAPVIRQAASAPGATVSVRAADSAGRTLARATLQMGRGQDQGAVRLPMPTELRNRVARLDIEGEETAGAVVLLDDRWLRRPVGLIDTGAEGSSSPLLNDIYYVDRAMSPFAEIRRGTVTELLKRDLSLAILPDSGSLSDADETALRGWVRAGGVLLRLAGPKLARHPDELLPVRLRGGGRTLGGAMSWTQPMAIAPMPDKGPFTGLAVPSDVRVQAQVLAEPEIDLNDKTWARLADGTPLVTGTAEGKGWLVLLHTTAWPEWSNLSLSGLFPEMLQRLLALSRGVAGGVAERPLPPLELLDGFGRQIQPSGIVEALPPKTTAIAPSPRHPPGYYGDESGRIAINLAPEIPSLAPLVPPPGMRVTELGGEAAERDLQPPLLLAALLLLLADALAVAALRGRTARIGRVAAAVLLAVLVASPAHDARADDSQVLAAALQTRLAYVITGDARVDDVSRAGLAGLTLEISDRTTASLGQPVGVDVSHDPLMVYPLLYWPVTGTQAGLPAAARDAINDYLRHGGMIMFDTRDGGQGGTEALRNLTAGIDIPALAEVNSDHVLTRSFYLLRDMPGRITGAPVFAQQGGDPANDNVSPVVIGGNDYAGAWALDQQNEPMFPTVPGGEQQRELAYRFGINLVMYALTGSYKSDQVHLPIILERLKR